MNTHYSFVLVKPRLNPRRTSRLVKAGIGHNVRSAEHNREIAERHAAEASEHGRDGFRGNRTDATGQRQADSGTPIFGWNGARHESVTLARITTDLVAAGYVMTGAWLQQKEDDMMSTLNLKFEPVGGTEPAHLSEAAAREINATLAQSWRHVHIYRNPNGSATVNPSHMVGEQELAGIFDPRSLRMSAGGSFRNEKIH